MIIKLSDGRDLPIEMYKARVVQKTTLPPIAQRLRAIEEAGYNTFLLWTKDIFIDLYEEPPVLRFFTGKLKTLDNWSAKLAAAFRNDFGETV